jgi:tetratricopeptide (TPR) repeat protein
MTASLHQLRREPQLTHELAEAAVALATEQGFSLFAAGASALLGWARVQQSQSEDGIPQILRGIEASSSGGFFPLPILAEAYRKVGQTEAGLVALNEAVSLVDKTGTRCYEAELHRLKGELLLMQNAMNVAQAESCFQQAIELARKQSAKSLELRATVSFARLLRDTNRRDEARPMLAEIYNWFTEGFDTADLKDAKALLEELKS